MSAQAIRLNCLFNKRSSRWLDWIKARGATPSAEMLLRGLSRASRSCVPRGLVARGMTAMAWPVRDLPRRRQMTVEERLVELGVALPEPVTPKGNYALAVRTGNLLFLAGHIPQKEGGALITGKVGADVTVDEAYQAARLIAVNILGTLKGELGSLERVKRIVKLVGFVNCADGFAQQPSVINGASDFFVQVLGAKGIHARSAVGTNALPLNVPVEIEAIVEIED